jgi:hypothetical protein
MNRRRLVWVLVVALCLAAAGLALWLPRYAAAQRVSDLYRRYEHNPHLTVAYLEDFPVNDTLTVDVTTIRALDAAGWDTLTADFNIPKLPEFMQEKIDAGKDIVGVRLTPKTAPGQPMDTTDLLKNNVIGISRKNHTISIFNTDTEEQQNAVANYNFRKGY